MNKKEETGYANFLKLKIVSIPVLLLFIFTIIAYGLKCYGQIFYPYQLEFRETAVASILIYFQKGLNPYQYTYLPQSTYVYGIGYPAIVAFFTSVFHSNVLITARLISFISILGSVALVFVTINQVLNYKHKLISLAFAVSLFILWDQHAGVGAIPTALSVLLITICICIPYLFAFSLVSCIVCCLISISGFLIKPYCLLPAIYIVSYLFLFIDIRKGLWLSLISIVITIVLFFCFQAVFPAYFAVTYFGFACANISSFNHMLTQLKSITDDFLIVKYFIVLSILIVIIKPDISFKFEKLKFKLDKAALHYFVDKPFNFFGYCAFLGILVFALKLGHHAGAFGGGYLTHFFFAPFVIYLASNYVNLPKRYLLDSVFILIVLFNSIYMYHSFNNSAKKLRENLPELQKLQVELSAFNKIYNSAEAASIMLNLNKEIYNNGQMEYFEDILNCESPVKEKSKKALDDYKSGINQKIESGFFDLILRTHDYFGREIIDKALLEKHYQLTKIQSTPVGEGSWQTEWWIKKISKN